MLPPRFVAGCAQRACYRGAGNRASLGVVAAHAALEGRVGGLGGVEGDRAGLAVELVLGMLGRSFGLRRD